MCKSDLVLSMPQSHLMKFTGSYRSCSIYSSALFFSMLRYLVFFIRTVQQLQGQCRYVTEIYCAMSPKKLRHCSKPDRSKIQYVLLLLDVPLLKGVWKINFMPDLKHPNAWVNSLPGIINIHSLILPRTGSESEFLSWQRSPWSGGKQCASWIWWASLFLCDLSGHARGVVLAPSAKGTLQ